VRLRRRLLRLSAEPCPYEEVWDKGNPAEIDTLVAPGIVLNDWAPSANRFGETFH